MERRSGRKLAPDEDAEITGLPLMLLILVVVAGIVTFIVLGWTGKLGDGPDGVGDVAFYTYRFTAPDSDPAATDEIERIEIRSTTTTTAAEAKFTKPTTGTGTVFALRILDHDNAPVAGAIAEIRGSVAAAKSAVADANGYAKFDEVTFQLPSGELTGESKISVKKSGWPDHETTLIIMRK